MVQFDLSMPETWHPIPDYPRSEISSHLRIRGPRGLRMWAVKPQGYRYVLIWKDGKYHIVYLHHLVALLAIGPRPEGLNVLHRDDDRANNWPTNLYYGTQKQNRADSKRNGKEVAVLGTARPNAKLNEDRVREIRALAASGLNKCEISRRIGIDRAIVVRVISGERWGHVN